MDKKQVIQKIVETIKSRFEKYSFENKRQRFFEKKEGENLFQYEIDLVSKKGYFSLHLKLSLLNSKISKVYNSVMRKALTDEHTIFPINWSQKDIERSIKTRSTGKKVAMLTDWRNLREDNESLEHFNSRFSIWLCTFNKLNEKEDWKEQLLLSVELAIKWFDKVQTDEYLINNTNLFGLCVLKIKGNEEKLHLKFNEIIKKMKSKGLDTKEIELFFKYLMI